MRAYAPIILLLAGIAGGYAWAKAVGDHRYAELERDLAQAEVQATQAVLKLERARQLRSEALAESVLLDMELEHERSKEVVVEVVRYERTPGAGDCDLTVDWVWAHDLAASPATLSGSPEAAGYTPAGPGRRSGITDIEALDTATRNYGLCRQWRAEVIGWRRFGQQLTQESD